MINVRILADYGKDENGDRQVVYTVVEDGQERGGYIGANPSFDEFVKETKKFLDVLRSRGEVYSVSIDPRTHQGLLQKANEVASLL